MTGEGADELLAGYDIFKEAVIRRFWARYPGSKYRPLLFKRLYQYVPQISTMNARMLQFVFGYRYTDTDHPFYAYLQRWNNGSFMRNYFSRDLKQQLADSDPVKNLEQIVPQAFFQWDKLSQALWVESRLLLSNYLLSSQGDRMGMAHSIEGRYPFLDYRVIEYASKLPPDFKLNGLNEKYLLKKIMHQSLPDSVLKRSKQAYPWRPGAV
jgi:asparagine synthase (glutamine-hydrolysing)